MYNCRKSFIKVMMKFSEGILKKKNIIMCLIICFYTCKRILRIPSFFFYILYLYSYIQSVEKFYVKLRLNFENGVGVNGETFFFLIVYFFFQPISP